MTQEKLEKSNQLSKKITTKKELIQKMNKVVETIKLEKIHTIYFETISGSGGFQIPTGNNNQPINQSDLIWFLKVQIQKNEEELFELEGEFESI